MRLRSMARKSSTVNEGVTWPPLASWQAKWTVSPEEMVSRGGRSRLQREWVGSAVKVWVGIVLKSGEGTVYVPPIAGDKDAMDGAPSMSFSRDGEGQFMLRLFDLRPIRWLCDFDDHLEFDEGVAWERADSDGGADVFAGFAEDLDEEIGCAIDDFGRVREAGDGCDIAVDADDALDGVE